MSLFPFSRPVELVMSRSQSIHFRSSYGSSFFGEALAYGVRVTVIEPGAVELITSTKHEGTRQAVATAFYAPETKILQDGDIAHAILYAVTRPAHVSISELMMR